MRKKTSAIRVRNANPVAASLCEASQSLTERRYKKSCRIQSESCSSILRIQLRLIFDYHTLNRAMFSRSRVINPDFLTGSQWCRHNFASRVNNVRSRAESETYRALLAPDDNRLARLICTLPCRSRKLCS